MGTSGTPDDSNPDPRTQLFRAIARMPSDLREVTRLMLVERWTEEDVAEMLDLEVEEVRRRLEEGRERLLEDLDVDELTKWLR